MESQGAEGVVGGGGGVSVSNGVESERRERPQTKLGRGWYEGVSPSIIIDSFQIQYSICSTNTFYYLMLKLGLLIDIK